MNSEMQRMTGSRGASSPVLSLCPAILWRSRRRRGKRVADATHSAIRMTVLSLFLFGGFLRASTVALTVDSVDPDPVLVGQPAAVQVSAAFTADGTEQTQLTDEWTVEYRYYWSLSPDGAVGDLSPEPADGGWTVWSASPVCSGSCTFPTTGIKSLFVMCQVRLRNGEDIGDVCAEGSVTTPIACTVGLADAVNFHAVEVGTDWVRLRWEPSPDAGVAGYAYHIEPDELTTVDVGNVTETVVSDLEPGVEYEFGLHAYDAEGNMTHTVFACATTEPEPPSNVTAYGEDGFAIIIFKRSPTTTVIGYRLEQSTDAGASWSSCSPWFLPGWYPDEPYNYGKVRVSGLTNGTTCRFRVSALPAGGPSPTVENPESADIIPSPFFDLYLTKAKINRWRACMKYNDCQPVGWSARPRSVAEIEELHTVLEEMDGRALIPDYLSYDDCEVVTSAELSGGMKTETVYYDTGPWQGVAIPEDLPGGAWLVLPADGNRGLLSAAMAGQPDAAIDLLTYWRGAAVEELVADVIENRLECLYEYYDTDGLICSVPQTFYSSGIMCGLLIDAYRSYYLFDWGVWGEREYTWEERYLTVKWNALPTDVVDAFSIQTGFIPPGAVESFTILPRGDVGRADEDPSAWATGPFPDGGPLLAGEYVGQESRPGENELYQLMVDHEATVTDIEFKDGSGNVLTNGSGGYAMIVTANETAVIRAWATYAVETTPPCEFTVPLSVELSPGETLAHLSSPDQFHAIRPGLVTLSATASNIGGESPLSTTKTIKVAIPDVKLTRAPSVVCAQTVWAHANLTADDYRCVISVTVDPPDYENLVDLEILSVEPSGDGQGTLTKISDTEWHYTALAESQGDKWPGRDDPGDPGARTWDVVIRDSWSGEAIDLKVRCVFRYCVMNEHDEPMALEYVKWKYASFITVHGLTTGTYDPSLAEYGKTSVQLGTVTYGDPAFTTENILISTIGHEDVHVDQGFAVRNAAVPSQAAYKGWVKASLVPAPPALPVAATGFPGLFWATMEAPGHTWEKDHATETGIDNDADYIDLKDDEINFHNYLLLNANPP